ncbi:MAG: glycosyltransferase family 2 protein [Verrucomicrobiota bacterium]
MPPLLSAILIVKNEEKNLPRCLTSLQGVCDEICVVDTGSTDNSAALARDAGAEISSFEWNGNESDARNASARMAKGKWLFMIDADEEVSPELARELKEKLPVYDSDESAQSLSLIWRNHYQDGSTSLTRITRISRNFPEFIFSGNIHPVANYRTPTVSLEGCLNHYGYIWTPEQREKKGAHMLAHLEPLIQGEHPPLGRLCQYLTYLLVCKREKDFSQRLAQAGRYSFEERMAEPYWRQALGNILPYLAEKDDFTSAKNFAEEILPAHPNFVSALFFLLQDSVHQRNWEATVHYAQRVLSTLEQSVDVANIMFPDIQKPSAQAWLWLAEMQLGRAPHIIPPHLIQSRIMHIILYAYEKLKPACAHSMIARLLRLRNSALESKKITSWSSSNILAITREARQTPRTPEHLLASLLLIEVLQQAEKMSESLSVLSEVLNIYPDHRWIAMAHLEENAEDFCERILHQP